MVNWYIQCTDINEVIKGQTLLLPNLYGPSHPLNAITYAEPAIGDIVSIDADNAEPFNCYITWISPVIIFGDLDDLDSIDYYECEFSLSEKGD